MNHHNTHQGHRPENGTIAEYVAALKASEKLGPQVTSHTVLPERGASFLSVARPWPRAMGDVLGELGIPSLYSHQAEAWAASARGEHLAVVTPTASGKSLCYTLPVVAAAMTRRAKALYLFPTKALAQDQVAELLDLSKAGDLGLKAFTFDGDTPGDARQAIRLHGDIVVSNPDMLHQAILPHHTK